MAHPPLPALSFCALFSFGCQATPQAVTAQPSAPAMTAEVEDIAVRCAHDDPTACNQLRDLFDVAQPDERTSRAMLPICTVADVETERDIDEKRAFCDDTGTALYVSYQKTLSREHAALGVDYFDASCKRFASLVGCARARELRDAAGLEEPEVHTLALGGVAPAKPRTELPRLDTPPPASAPAADGDRDAEVSVRSGSALFFKPRR